MTVYEVLTIALVAVLAAAATLAIYIGVLGLLGAFYLVRCPECDHFTFSAGTRAQHSCARCRHPILMHPLQTVRHPTRVRY
jgi:Zinc-ribbon containing domain